MFTVQRVFDRHELIYFYLSGQPEARRRQRFHSQGVNSQAITVTLIL